MRRNGNTTWTASRHEFDRRGAARASVPWAPVAGGEGTPAELVAEGAVEAVAGEADHGEGRLAAADGHPVAGLERDLNLAVDDQNRGLPFASRNHLDGLWALSTSGRWVSVWAQSGVTTNMWALGGRIGPPAERLCAVDPTGVAMIRPSPR